MFKIYCDDDDNRPTYVDADEDGDTVHQKGPLVKKRK